MKKCVTCGEEKPEIEFPKDRSKKAGIKNRCKPCHVEKTQESYWKDPEKKRAKYRRENLTPQQLQMKREKDRERYAEKREEIREKQKRYYQENKSKIYRKSREWREENREAVRDKNRSYRNHRYKTDPRYRVRVVIRSRLRNWIKRGNRQKECSMAHIVGCSWAELVVHLENQFEPGMTWDNHGEWHIDHVVPLASAETFEQAAKLCHYTNLQPLWAFDNMSKGGRWAKRK